MWKCLGGRDRRGPWAWGLRGLWCCDLLDWGLWGWDLLDWGLREQGSVGLGAEGLGSKGP